uniref:two-component regulator propeller domain-containing protein n=1 Tax=Pedobacter schmidteae TaxID=2201271 RepID=UPI000EAD545F|nr:two-component regulator propeller domain-containing protein [Pedobacter schmidteae]
MKYFLLILNIFFLSIRAPAQIGIPEINNYSSLTYKGGSQNWDIGQDKNGTMYFANNDGLLSYNGRYWDLYQLPNKTIIRSLLLDKDGRIYVGAQDELGYFFPDENGRLKYHSLLQLIPSAHRKFADVWNIVIDKNDVYFRSNSKILQYDHRRIRIYDKPRVETQWTILQAANGQVFAQDNFAALYQIKNGMLKMISSQAELKSSPITAIVNYQADTVLIGTLKNGLYLLSGSNLIQMKTAADAFFVKNRINKVLKLKDGTFLVATASGGCVIINKNGALLQHFDNTDGLQDSQVRSIFQDDSGSLWLGLDDGIDFIACNSALKYIRPDRRKQTSGYATQILNHQLFIGTSDRLYSAPLAPALTDFSYAKSTFKEIQHIQGQIWNLDAINNKLLVGHEEGTYVLEGDIPVPLFQALGTWTFVPLSANKTATEIVAGTYTGLHLMRYDKQKFSNAGKIKGGNESLRFVLYDPESNTIWASHPYRGVYRFKLSADHKKIEKLWLFNEKNGFPSPLDNFVVKLKGKIVVATKNGIYEFDENRQYFSPSKTLGPILGKVNFQYLKEDPDGNIWFVTNKKIGVVDFHRKQGNRPYAIVYFPELTAKMVVKFENIYPYDKQNIFVASTSGIIHINYLKYLKNIKPLKVHLTQVKISGNTDSIIFGGYFVKNGKITDVQYAKDKVSLPYAHNSLHFEYASTLFEQRDNIEFSYQLYGFDKEWSLWGSKCEKDYTNLPQGEYTFKVKVRNNLGNELLAAPYTFVIRPPWYQTPWFYFLYFLLFCFGIYLLIQWQKRKYRKEQHFLNTVHQLELEQNEKIIVNLRNEKLETKVHFQNKELASTTMHLMQRGKLLATIKDELLLIKKEDTEGVYREELRKVLRLIHDSEKSDADWDQFAERFDHVNSNFLKILKEKVPSLTPTDLKLCAYLKMNLSSKEIAQLMSITIRGVEVNRYRLRKKLNVSSETNLFDHLIALTRV